jgi:lipoprotein signal peptidase
MKKIIEFLSGCWEIFNFDSFLVFVLVLLFLWIIFKPKKEKTKITEFGGPPPNSVFKKDK